MKNRAIRERGSSLLELMVAVVVFTFIIGTSFLLLNTAQQRFQMESQVLDSFQTARLAVDQITRDVHGAGYPPANAVWPAVAAASPQLIALPFAWSPNYPATPCTVGACTTPGNFDLIIEGNISPSTGAGVQWIRYQLQGTSLMRGVAPKVSGTDPATATAATMVAYVDNAKQARETKSDTAAAANPGPQTVEEAESLLRDKREEIGYQVDLIRQTHREYNSATEDYIKQWLQKKLDMQNADLESATAELHELEAQLEQLKAKPQRPQASSSSRAGSS